LAIEDGEINVNIQCVQQDLVRTKEHKK